MATSSEGVRVLHTSSSTIPPNPQKTDIAVTVSTFPPFQVQANSPSGISLTVARRSPLPLPLPDPRPQQSLTTETLYRAPPTSVPSPPEPKDDGNGVPIGAIAGGAAAGVILAILVVVGWIWWGRTIKRDAEIQRLETATRRNTMKNAGKGPGGISRPKARTSHLHGRPIEKAVSFAPSTPTSTDEANTPIANAHPRTFAFDEKTGLKPITNGKAGFNGHEVKANGITNHGRTNGNGNPAPPPTSLSAPHAQPQSPPPVSQTRGKRPAYSRRSLKHSPPRGILATPSQLHENGNGQVNGRQGQGHQRQASAAPLLAEHYMDENRGRRIGDPEEGPREHEYQMKRTPSGMLWAALGLGSSDRNSTRTSRNSRWSWTSSLDMKLFGQRTQRGNGGDGNSKSAKTSVVAGSVEEDRASGSVPMGVAM